MKDQIIDNPETNLYTPDNNKRNIHDQLVVNSPKSRDTSVEERENSDENVKGKRLSNVESAMLY